MLSTTEITRYTPAVLKAVCKQRRIKKRKYRLLILKHIQSEIHAIVEKSDKLLTVQDWETLTKLDHMARLAIGEE